MYGANDFIGLCHLSSNCFPTGNMASALLVFYIGMIFIAYREPKPVSAGGFSTDLNGSKIKAKVHLVQKCIRNGCMWAMDLRTQLCIPYVSMEWSRRRRSKEIRLEKKIMQPLFMLSSFISGGNTGSTADNCLDKAAVQSQSREIQNSQIKHNE